MVENTTGRHQFMPKGNLHSYSATFYRNHSFLPVFSMGNNFSTHWLRMNVMEQEYLINWQFLSPIYRGCSYFQNNVVPFDYRRTVIYLPIYVALHSKPQRPTLFHFALSRCTGVSVECLAVNIRICSSYVEKHIHCNRSFIRQSSRREVKNDSFKLK